MKLSWCRYGHGHEQEADGGGAVALEQEVAEGEEVALGFGHLAAFDEQEADVHPVPGEEGARGGFGLGDLVFVMREHEVFAAGVEVEGVAEEAGGHGGALDVPAGAAGAEGGVPGVFAGAVGGGFDGLPEGEVAGGILFVVDVDARAVFHTVEVALGELAVGGKALDAEVPGAVFGLVGDVVVAKARLMSETISGMCSVARGMTSGRSTPRASMSSKKAVSNLWVYSRSERPNSGGVADDLVVDVGDVHDVTDGDAGEFERSAEDVDVEEGAEVADVAVVVDGGAAGVQAQGWSVRGREGFEVSAQGVEEVKGHDSLFPSF